VTEVFSNATDWLPVETRKLGDFVGVMLGNIVEM
jgi:hypothetical protein